MGKRGIGFGMKRNEVVICLLNFGFRLKLVPSVGFWCGDELFSPAIFIPIHSRALPASGHWPN